MSVFRFIAFACKGNARNAHYCARWMRMFMDHSCETSATNDLRAEEALREIFNADRAILEESIDAATLDGFIDKLRNSEDARFLKVRACAHVWVPIVVAWNEET